MLARRVLLVALLASFALLLAPTLGPAQSFPERAGENIARVVEILSTKAHSAAVAFGAETPSVQPRIESTSEIDSLLRTKRALVAVGAVAGIGIFIALVVLITAQGPLEAVARAAERDVARSFWIGLLWQVLAVPLLLILALALTLTIILIPAIPIAMLMWALAYAGAMTLGLFAVSLVLGRAVLRKKTTYDRRALLSGLLCGLLLLTAVWVAAAVLVSLPIAGILTRLIALALSWVAATVGLGAVVRSRGGTLREHTEVTTESAVPSWQTPTPVFGVAAARRPTPVNTKTLE
ncbi:MAG: hypothetical protein M3Y64_06315 [Gemmatimonadota bacterium]|nr:hypothetical protein [Gemmatimonadota bacterium]